MSPESALGVSATGASPEGAGRRIAALVLPEIFLLAAGALSTKPEGPAPLGSAAGAAKARPTSSRTPLRAHPHAHPQAVVLLPPGREQVEPTDRLTAVCSRAARQGVRSGQTVTEARALVAALGVLPLQPARLDALLLELCEVLRAFGSPVAIAGPDVVLVDVSGVGHLYGGELELCRELAARARELGHVSQVALASGPRIAAAVARMGRLDARGTRVIVPGQDAAAVRELPLQALLSADRASWFARLGLLDVAQLLDLPPSTLAARLGPETPHILALARGVDDQPLLPCEFPRHIEVSLEWDEPLLGLEPLLFVLRGLSSRVSARLQGRGEAASLLELCLRHDPAISRYRGVAPETKISFELASPIHRDVEFERVLRTRLERTTLPAPTLGVSLCVSRLSAQAIVQLELGTRGASRRLQELPVLLSELETDVGAENIGILRIEDAHAPEARSRLEPIGPRAGPKRASARAQRDVPPDPLARATRLLAAPAALPVPLRVGESFVLGQSYYTIEKLEFATRLESISWWTSSAQSRDYVWAWLSGSSGGLQVLLFVDRRSKRAYVQGLAD